jgi:hypothetical protein
VFLIFSNLKALASRLVPILHAGTRKFRPSPNPRFPVDCAFLFSFSNNTHVESCGFPRVFEIAVPPTPRFPEENAVFIADFFPTDF